MKNDLKGGNHDIIVFIIINNYTRWKKGKKECFLFV